jgi:hypothetical protein
MSDRRFDLRSSVALQVSVQWRDGLGEFVTAAGLIREHSVSGAKILLKQPIPVNTLVTLSCATEEVLAKVRHCARANAEFILGLEFMQKVRWSRNTVVNRRSEQKIGFQKDQAGDSANAVPKEI